MQTIRLGGLLFETADSDELNYRAALRDAMLRTLGTSRFAVYHHVIRRRAEAALGAVEADDFSGAIAARWRGRQAGKKAMGRGAWRGRVWTGGSVVCVRDTVK